MAMLAEEKALYVVSEQEHEEEVSFKNPIRELGFAQIEHIIGLDTELSDGAYRTLSILHYFWQQKKTAYPSIETLAKLRGKDDATIRRHLAELGEKGIISRSRRVGTSSMTYLEDLPQTYIDAASAILRERKTKKSNSAKMSARTAQKCAVGERMNELKRITIEEEQVEEGNGDEVEISIHPAERLIENTIFGLGWKERQEIRAMAENDIELSALKECLVQFRDKVGKGEYRGTWGTLKKFWANTISTNKLRAPQGEISVSAPQWVTA